MRTVDKAAILTRKYNIGEILTVDNLDEEDRPGAISEYYRRGHYSIHINRYVIGSLSKKKISWLRYQFIKYGIGWLCWSYQVSYAGSSMGTKAWSRRSAVRECRKWIDKQIAKVSLYDNA
jgi:hypothetical protein